jgi:hypothetical protein
MMGKKNKLKGAALSALTLLAFLFFLNLLQNCLKEQMAAMNPTVSIKYSLSDKNAPLLFLQLFQLETKHLVDQKNIFSTFS